MNQDAQGEHRRGSPRDCEFRRPVGDQLKVLFGELAHEPMPDRLRQLAEELENAFQRGDLCRRRPKAS